VAQADCESRGWDVVGVYPAEGTVVCTTGGVSVYSNCDNCDVYNIYAWTAGAREQVCLDDGYTGASNAEAGMIYGGHSPCECGPNLLDCELPWDMKDCMPD
jgi:hypothetical protein